MSTAANVLLIATLISVLLCIISILGSKIGRWFSNRDKRIAVGHDALEESVSVRAASITSEAEIGVMIKANQETNTKIGKLYEMIESLDKSGSKGSARMLEKFDLKLEGFSAQLVEFDKQLVRLDTIVKLNKLNHIKD